MRAWKMPGIVFNSSVFCLIPLVLCGRYHYSPIYRWWNELQRSAMCAKSLQSCLTHCNPMHCCPIGQVAMTSSRGPSWFRKRTYFTKVSCIGLQVVYHSTIWGAQGSDVSVMLQLFATPRTVDCQAPLSLELSRQEYWSGLSFPARGSSRRRDWTQISCTAGNLLYHLSY